MVDTVILSRKQRRQLKKGRLTVSQVQNTNANVEQSNNIDIHIGKGTISRKVVACSSDKRSMCPGCKASKGKRNLALCHRQLLVQGCKCAVCAQKQKKHTTQCINGMNVKTLLVGTAGVHVIPVVSSEVCYQIINMIDAYVAG